MNKKILYCIMISFVLLSCIEEKSETSGNEILTVGDTLPGFTVCNKTNCIEKTDLEGKNSLVFFFDTECGDCQKVFPEVESLYRQYADNPDFILLAIAREQTEEKVSSYFSQHNYTFPFYTDKDRSVYKKFATSIVPRFFLSNTQGIIQYVVIENLNTTELKKNIDRLLTEK